MKDSKTKTLFLENLKKFNYILLTNIDEIKTSESKILVSFNDIQYETTPKNIADGYLPHRNNSLKIKDINDYKKRVYDLVGDEFQVVDGEVYINNKTPIKMIHKTCGRIIDTLTPGTFLNGGKRCKYCAHKYTPDEDEINEKLKNISDEFEIIKMNYKNLQSEITVKHKPCGYKYKTTIKKLLNGSKCPKCSNAILKSHDDFIKQVNIVGNGEFEVLDKYIDCKTKLRIKHKCGAIQEVRPFDFLYNRKNKCLNCKVKRESLEEDSLKDFISSLGFKTEKLRKTINNKNYELDVFIPELNIGFEFNGLYWHSENVNKDKLNLFHKMQAYNSIGIRVVNIFEDEWLFKNEIVKNKIKSILGKNNNETIYARKCIIKEPTTKEKNEFLDKYHIQGADKCKYKKGLYYEDKLIAVMTFSKLRNALGNKKSSNSNKYELSRFATSAHVPGGFSKLFRAIVNEYNIESVITYADLRWSGKNGNVYLKNGFQLDHQSRPNKWYHDGKKRYHRYNFRKNCLKEKFPTEYDDNLTEEQIMDKTKYKRIWDCGNLTYIWKK